MQKKYFVSVSDGILIPSDVCFIQLYTEKGENYFYDYEAKAFFKRQYDSLERIEPDGLPLGVRKLSDTKALSVVKRLGHMGVNRPIPGVTRLHYCYDSVQKEYLLKILPPYSQDDFVKNEDVFLVIPEESVPDYALQKCRQLDRIKEDVENGVVDRLLMGHW